MQIGIMQGRLLPRYRDRYQAFPSGYWHSEFELAKAMGFCSIEWIVDHDTYDENPITTEEGVLLLKTFIQNSGITVRSICFDLAMQAPFHSLHQQKTEQQLIQILPLAAQIGVTDIVLPCVDQSRLQSNADTQEFLESLERVSSHADTHGIFLNLETDLAPKPFKQLLSACPPCVRVNYDTGNSASLGYNPEEEFEAYGSLISDLHLKDRILNGGSVYLGTGNTNFSLIFDLLKAYQFNGFFTLQASRAESFSSEHAQVANQLSFLSNFLRRFYE